MMPNPFHYAKIAFLSYLKTQCNVYGALLDDNERRCERRKIHVSSLCLLLQEARRAQGENDEL